MKQKFKRAILYARSYRANHEVSESLHRLVDFLNTQDIGIYQDQDTATGFELKIPVLPRENMRAQNDLIIVIGGDGSMLSASRMAIKVNTPVIGINRGRLGFLTDILPQDIESHLGPF
nr:NAD(+)/NADH kinase [Legionella norrlandica]